MSVPSPAVFHHPVQPVVDQIQIVAVAAHHDIGAGAAVQHVIDAIANDRIVAPAANHIFEPVEAILADVLAAGPALHQVHRHRRGSAGEDEGVDTVACVIPVIAGTRGPDNPVVAVAAKHRIMAAPAGDRVVAAEPHEDVGVIATGQNIAVAVAFEVKAGRNSREVIHIQFVKIDADKNQLVTGIGEADLRILVAVDRNQQGREGCPVADFPTERPKIDTIVTRSEIGNGVNPVPGKADKQIFSNAPGEFVVTGTAIQGIVTTPAIDRVVAAKARHNIVVGIADEHVGVRIPRSLDRRADQRQVFDIGGEHAVHRAHHRVDALAGVFRHHISGIVADIQIVAAAARHGVGALAAIQHVGRRVTGQNVIRRVADGFDGIAGQRQILKVPAESVVDGADHDVPSRARLFDDDVTPDVDVKHVVPGAANHDIGARPAVYDVVSIISDENVVAAVAGRVDVVRARQNQLLKVLAEDVRYRALHPVDAAPRLLARNHVAGIVDDIDVVAPVPHHVIGARSTVEDVAAGIPLENIVAGIAPAREVRAADQRQVFNVGTSHRQIEAHRAVHLVGSLAGNLHYAVLRAVDDILVVAGAAHHGVVARPAIDRVVAAKANQNIVVGIADEHVSVRIPRSLDRRADERQVFDIGGEHAVRRAHHRVNALAGVFRHHISGVIADVQIVAAAARHGVGALAAIQHVGRRIAGQNVIRRVADGFDGIAGQRQILKVPAESVVDGADHDIPARARRFDDDVTPGVDVKHVVPGAAFKPVRAGAAIQRVVSLAATKQIISTGAKEGVVAFVAREGVVDVVARGGNVAGAVHQYRVLAVLDHGAVDHT